MYFHFPGLIIDRSDTVRGYNLPKVIYYLWWLEVYFTEHATDCTVDLHIFTSSLSVNRWGIARVTLVGVNLYVGQNVSCTVGDWKAYHVLWALLCGRTILCRLLVCVSWWQGVGRIWSYYCNSCRSKCLWTENSSGLLSTGFSNTIPRGVLHMS